MSIIPAGIYRAKVIGADVVSICEIIRLPIEFVIRMEVCSDGDSKGKVFTFTVKDPEHYIYPDDLETMIGRIAVIGVSNNRLISFKPYIVNGETL